MLLFRGVFIKSRSVATQMVSCAISDCQICQIRVTSGAASRSRAWSNVFINVLRFCERLSNGRMEEGGHRNPVEALLFFKWVSFPLIVQQKKKKGISRPFFFFFPRSFVWVHPPPDGGGRKIFNWLRSLFLFLFFFSPGPECVPIKQVPFEMDWLKITLTVDFRACSFSIIAFAEGCTGSKRRFDNATEAWRLKKKKKRHWLREM